MSTLFFHVRNRNGLLIDEEGSDMTLEAAIDHCLECVRDLISADIRQGAFDLAQSIVITDASGRVIREVPFIRALNFQHSQDQGSAMRCPVLVVWGGPVWGDAVDAHMTAIQHTVAAEESSLCSRP
jgi:hypothetical protein